MGILQSIKQKIANKADSIRRERADEEKIKEEIRRRVAEVSRKERIEQAERLTKERIKMATDAEIKRLRTKSSFSLGVPGKAQSINNIISSSVFGGYGSTSTPQRYKIKKRRRGKKTIITRTAMPSSNQRYDVFGGGSSRKFNPITGSGLWEEWD